ncbi:MAG: AMP-binding protein, partial [Myxococcales bacterium]|nr:AMP-binding protein [Myxococcales bacterium]
MMRYPLTTTHLLERAARIFGRKRVVSAGERPSVAHTWSELEGRVRRLAAALVDHGVRPGDRVATFGWNTHRHLELYFAAPAIGAVLHTVNVRLSGPQIEEVIGHGGAHILFAEPELLERVDDAALDALDVRVRVSLSDRVPSGWRSYESLLDASAPLEVYPSLDEDSAAGLCYTSGTTGEPKGVRYSHRAIVLHTFAICLPDGFGLGERDVILPAVPMFHANAWGLAHAAAMTGATLVLPGVHPDAPRLAALLEEEQVTFAAGV